MKEHYKSKGSDHIRKQIESMSGAEQASAVFSRANALCEEFLSKAEIPKGTERMHVNGIAERTALYKVLKEQYPDKAWEWIDEQTRIDSQRMRAFINRITSNRLLRSIFMPMMRTMTKKMFDPPSGFAQNIVESKKDSF